MSDMMSSISSSATGAKGADIANQIGMAIMKQTMDQQKQMGQAIVQMIQSMPTPDGTGTIVNKAA